MIKRDREAEIKREKVLLPLTNPSWKCGNSEALLDRFSPFPLARAVSTLRAGEEARGRDGDGDGERGEEIFQFCT